MSQRITRWEAAEAELSKAQAQESAKVGLVYDLFRKTLKEDHELQWDRIVNDMHAKDPWEDLRGAKHDGLRRKSMASLGSASISTSSRCIPSMQRRGKGFTCYVT